MYQYKYVACKRCNSENIDENELVATGEKTLLCKDCGWYSSRNKTIQNPYGTVEWFNVRNFEKLIRPVESKEEYEIMINDLLQNPDVNYIMFSHLFMNAILKQRIK